MNFGYNVRSVGWDESRKQKLATDLSAGLGYPLGWIAGENPYIEIDGLYEGVRIRRISKLHEEIRPEVIRTADIIYRSVMDVI